MLVSWTVTNDKQKALTNQCTLGSESSFCFRFQYGRLFCSQITFLPTVMTIKATRNQSCDEMFYEHCASTDSPLNRKNGESDAISLESDLSPTGRASACPPESDTIQ